MVSIKKNFVYQMIWQVLSMALPLITSPLLARTIGAEGIGVYAYISAVVGYFALAANLGVYKYAVRQLASVNNNKEEFSKVFKEIWVLHGIISVFIGILYVIYTIKFSEYRLYFSIMSFLYIGKVLDINWLYAGIEDFRKVTIRDTIVKLFSFALVIIFVREENDLIKYVVIMSLSTFLGSLIYWVSFRQYVKKVSIEWKNILPHVKGFFILFIPVMLESIYSVADKIMLGAMDTKSSVGFYENAEKALIANRIIHALSIVITPRMSHLISNKSNEQVHQLMKKSMDVSMLLSVAFAFGTAAVAKEFSVVFWGEKFSTCTTLIMVMAMAMPAMAISRVIREEYLIPADEDRKYILSAGVGAATDIILNVFLIPHCGAMGAAISTLVAENAVLLVQGMVIRKQLPLSKYMKGNYIYIFFGIIMFAIVRIIGEALGISLMSLLIEIVAGIIIYTILCCVYWKITSQTYYFNVARTLYHKSMR